MKKQITKVQEFINTTAFEDVYNYYIVENHSKHECIIYFNVTERIFRGFLEHYHLKKPRELVKQLGDKTKLEKYGDANYNNFEKCKQTCLDKFGVASPLANKEIHNKTINTQKEKYGGTGFGLREPKERIALAKKANKAMWDKYHTDDAFSAAYQDKQNETKKKNKSFNTSKRECVLFDELCQKYGANNVVQQYKDDRYPFVCDFYIKSQDLFIELNAHWTHGEHPFNSSSEDDVKKLNIWKEKAKTSKFYLNAIETWTIRDVNKLNCFINNKLNFIILYNNLEVKNESKYT